MAQCLADRTDYSENATHSGAGEGLIFYGDVILPFVDKFPTDIELYRIMTTRLSEIHEKGENTAKKE